MKVNADKGEQRMKAIEFNTIIDEKGHVCLPDKFQYAYGKSARFLILLPEETESVFKERKPGTAKEILSVLSEDDTHLDDFADYMP